MTRERTSLAKPPAGLPTDEQLAEQARGGDFHAFGQLVERYQGRVLNTCWRICGRREDAEDLAQEAFLNALEALGRFESRSRFYTWLYRIAVNVALSHVRARRQAVTLRLRMDGDHQAAALQAWRDRPGESPSARLTARETQQRLTAGLERLDDDHRAVVVLRDIEGLDYAEIGQILGIARGTVKSRLHRARMALRDYLRAEMLDA